MEGKALALQGLELLQAFCGCKDRHAALDSYCLFACSNRHKKLSQSIWKMLGYMPSLQSDGA